MSTPVTPDTYAGFTIAIDGPGGAGKTTLGGRLVEQFGGDPARQLIHTDDYFEPAHIPGVEAVDGAPGGFNVGRFMLQIGQAINDPTQAMLPQEYDWQAERHNSLPLPDQRKLVVVEGIKLIGLPVNWGAKLWIDTPRELRQQRFIARQVQDRRIHETNEDVLLERFNRWADDALAYEESVDPHNRPDILVVPGTIALEAQLELVLPLLDELRAS